MKKIAYFLTCLGLLGKLSADPIVLADFEGQDYGAWVTTGTAFGKGPAQGTLPYQMHVDGFQGHGLVNSFYGGDKSVGTLTSPSFKIERKYLNFLIGGGGWEGKTCMNLVVGGKVVRTATGSNTEPGGSETLEPASWDVSSWLGQDATLVIVDQAQGGWGHILVDQITLDDKPTASPVASVALVKDFTVQQSHLLIPIANASRGKKSQTLNFKVDGAVVQALNLTLPQADEKFWWAAYPLSFFPMQGKTLQISVEGKANSALQAAFERIHLGTEAEARSSEDYHEPYRNQLHASTWHGWNNDPNGMVFAQGKYHLYYQYNPVGIFWGNMHWGHLESTDLVHWQERPIALFAKTPRDAAYSGGGFIDTQGSGSLGKGTQFATYTSTGRGECVVYSQDGGQTFKEISENPVVKHRGRDPRVFRDEAHQQWVMAVYSEDAWAEAGPADEKNRQHADRHIAFYGSQDLHQWQWLGAFTDPDRSAVYECPEIFQLAVTGKPNEKHWILMAASNRYFIGQFDGKTFHKESGPHGTRHGAFYAAQTFSDVPDGRRIQVGWLLTNSYEKLFPTQSSNQGFTLPHELTLHETPVGLRLKFQPVRELETLRDKVLVSAENLSVDKLNQALQVCQEQLCEVQLTLSRSAQVKGTIAGIDVSFEGQQLRLFVDRTVTESFIDGGLSYEIYKRGTLGFYEQNSELKLPEGVTVKELKIFRLKSIWSQ